MLTFQIHIRTGYKDLRFTVTRILANERVEQYQVHARNKTIILETNRPLFRNKGLKYRKPDWTLVGGEMIYQRDGMEKLSSAIMAAIEPPKPVYVKPPKNPIPKSARPPQPGESHKRKVEGVMLKDRKRD